MRKTKKKSAPITRFATFFRFLFEAKFWQIRLAVFKPTHKIIAQNFLEQLDETIGTNKMNLITNVTNLHLNGYLNETILITWILSKGSYNKFKDRWIFFPFFHLQLESSFLYLLASKVLNLLMLQNQLITKKIKIK